MMAHFNRQRPLAALLVLLASAGTALAAPGTVLRDADLKTSAALDAPNVGQLTAGGKVDILSFEGGWAKVKSEAGTGYTRLLNVRPLKADGGMVTNPLQEIDKIGNVARTGSTGNTATTGAKGLSKDDMSQAQPNTAGLEKFKQSGATGSGNPTDPQLKARAVDLLPGD